MGSRNGSVWNHVVMITKAAELSEAANDTTGPTFACVNEDGEPSEKLLTKPADYKQKPRAIDHVFTDQDVVSAHVEAFKNGKPATQEAFQQVSDHRTLAVVVKM